MVDSESSFAAEKQLGELGKGGITSKDESIKTEASRTSAYKL